MLMTAICTLPDALDHAVSAWGNDIFIEDGTTQLSYVQCAQQVNHVAKHLLTLGVKPNDCVALWMPNRYEWIIACLAVHRAGGVVVPLNTRFKGREAEQAMRASRCVALVSIGHFLGVDYPACIERHTVPSLKRIIAVGEDSAAADIQWQTLLSEPTPNISLPTVTGDMVSDIIFTSGTTGEPKGVVTKHQQNIQTFSIFARILGLNHDDRYLIINPFFHSFGYKAGMLACLLSGARILPEAVFDVGHILARIERDRISVLPGPPTIFQAMLAHPARTNFNLDSLTKATTGAAVIPTQLIIDMRQTLGIETVITAYGLSESCGLATMCRPGDSESLIATSSGRAIEGVEVAIMDSEGHLVEAGVSGEIVIRGYNVMAGYLDNPDATSHTIDTDGWLHTGDIGCLDEGGNLRITDRLKDMYICGGFNCYPAEIENALGRHPEIVTCAVIGVADERLGEVGALFYTTTKGALDHHALHQWCRDNLANYKVPRSFHYCETLPLTASGKVHKPSLRQMWQALDPTGDK
jgi:HIP---CoA ligase